jgi:allantoate deiminase
VSNPTIPTPPASPAASATPTTAISSEITAAANLLLERCDALGRVSDDAPRITRTFLSPATAHAHALVTQWMQSADLTIHTDAAGNLIGRRAGSIPGAKTLAIGSHLDTIPNAGKYDGILGVLASIALADLTKHTPLPFALEIVAFSEEEGVRFSKPYIGSHAYAGTLDPAWLQLTDKSGTTVEQAIQNFGLNPTPLKTLKPRTDLQAYIELHIEQGPVLQSLGLPLGIVSAIAGQTRMMLEFIGIAGHAGTTPMSIRSDALTAAAEFILAVEAHAQEIPGLVATVGRIDASPNASNVIPGDVHLSVDIRHAKDAVRENAVSALLSLAGDIPSRRRIRVRPSARADFPAVPMSNPLAAALEQAADPYLPHRLVSGAGHDASVLAAIAPTAMLFVRSPGGVSHHPEESVIAADIAIALRTLRTLLAQDRILLN